MRLQDSKAVRQVRVGFNQQQLVLLDRLARLRATDRATTIKKILEEYRTQHPELDSGKGPK